MALHSSGSAPVEDNPGFDGNLMISHFPAGFCAHSLCCVTFSRRFLSCRKALQTRQASGQSLWAAAAWQLRGESAAVLPHIEESIGDEAEHQI